MYINKNHSFVWYASIYISKGWTFWMIRTNLSRWKRKAFLSSVIPLNFLKRYKFSLGSIKVSNGHSKVSQYLSISVSQYLSISVSQYLSIILSLYSDSGYQEYLKYENNLIFYFISSVSQVMLNSKIEKIWITNKEICMHL